MPAKKQNTKKRIEADFETLNKILQEFEAGKLSLEESIDKYKQAHNLLGAIKKHLEAAEVKIREIQI